MRPARVAAIALNTRGLTDDEARAAIDAASSETGLPAGDPVRFAGDALLDAAIRPRLGCALEPADRRREHPHRVEG